MRKGLNVLLVAEPAEELPGEGGVSTLVGVHEAEERPLDDGQERHGELLALDPKGGVDLLVRTVQEVCNLGVTVFVVSCDQFPELLVEFSVGLVVLDDEGGPASHRRVA